MPDLKDFVRNERVTTVTYALCFDIAGKPGNGWSFPCDEHGVVRTTNQANDAMLDNLDACLSGKNGEHDVVARGVKRFERTYREPNQGVCSCGETVDCDRFTNTCDGCGADYDSGGNRLAPRSQWGEETGESVSDILSIP